MAIFSSGKSKSKKEGMQSPNLNSSTGSFVPRSASGGSSTVRYTQDRAMSPPHGNYVQHQQLDASPASSVSASNAAAAAAAARAPSPPHALLSSTTANAAPPMSVLYPWSQRRLALLPALLIDDEATAHADAPTTKPGAISPAPFPRYGHSVNPVAAHATGELYIFGGLVQNEVKNDLYVLHCAELDATAAATAGQAPLVNSAPLNIGLVGTSGEIPGPRVGHASVGVGNVLIVWGGDTKSHPDDVQDDGLYLLNLSTKEWTRVKVSGPVPEGRYGHAAAMVGSRFFLFGGQKDDGGFMNDLVWFDLQKLKTGSPRWTFVNYPKGAIVPPKRTGHTAVTHGDCIYIFGGTDGQYHYNDTWCYDTNAGSWVELSCIGYIPVPREGHSACLVDDVMYIFGGRGVDGKDLEDLAAFKISNQRWFMFQNMGPAPSGRSGHAMATYQNKVLVLGGESYTSQRADDPAFVHILDTSKIKYPSDSRKSQPVQRKSSLPAMVATEGERSTSSMSDKAFGNGHSVKSPQAVVADQASNGPPTRPARPDDDRLARRTPDHALGRDSDRVASPSNSGTSRPRAASQGSGSAGPRSIRPISPPAPHSITNSLPSLGSASAGPHDKVVDHQVNGSAAPPADAFYYGARPPDNVTETLKSKEAELTTLRAHQAWMLAALSSAMTRGFIPPSNVPEHFEAATKIGDSADDRSSVLLQLKQDLASAKSSLADRARLYDDRLDESSKATAIALQEAAFLRAKLAAIESGSAADLNHAERRRLSELEQHVSETATAKYELQQHVTRLEAQLADMVGEKALFDERHQAAVSRADAAESSYSRALSDYADLQKRVHSHESTLQYHVERIASLTSSASQAESENARLKKGLEMAEAAADQHSRAMKDAQAALLASATQHDELRNMHQRLVMTANKHETQNAHLQAQLASTQQEMESLRKQLESAEQQLQSSHAAHAAAQALATGGLAELLATKPVGATRSLADSDNELQDRMRPLQEERDSLQRFLDELRGKHETATSKLDDALARHAQLQAQVVQLRGELAAVKSEAAQSRTSCAQLQAAVDARESEARDAKSRVRQSEIRVQLLRNFMAENNLSATDEELDRKYPEFDGTETPEDLHRRVQDLESRLEQQKKLYSELDASHQELSRDKEERSVLNASADDRTKRLETDLEALRTRHTQLEGTHLKAVQYVKGTEKMLRRMKEELTRYKDRCEELEAKSGALPEEHAAEMETLRAKAAEAESTKAQHADLQRKVAALEAEHERARSSSSAKADELTREVTRLDQELDKARHDLEETLAINASLNQQGVDYSTQAFFTEPDHRGWKRDSSGGRADANAALEERCRTAESKIALLLDHLEGGDSPEA
ncbi:hypothetical protein OIV83_006166 [Microbotryomycetes sp. JL201]|nr:hypothetical protein OIV83_006166 [Microbotryomycetes sp. JL201]